MQIPNQEHITLNVTDLASKNRIDDVRAMRVVADTPVPEIFKDIVGDLSKEKNSNGLVRTDNL